MTKTDSKIIILDFRKARFSLFVDLFGSIPWETASGSKGVQESWLIFKDSLLGAEERSFPACRKTNKHGRRPAWVNRELLSELRWRTAGGTSGGSSSTKILPARVGIESGKPKVSWNRNHQEKTRKAK